MSRGYGRVERGVLHYLGAGYKQRTVSSLTRLVFGVPAVAVTPLQRSSVRRALRKLHARGLVAGERDETGANRWSAVSPAAAATAAKAAAAQRRLILRIARAEANTARAIAEGRPPERCRWCNRERTPEGHDGCLGTLPGVVYACCGHGGDAGYVMFENGLTITGYFDHVNVPFRDRKIPMGITVQSRR